MTHRATGTAHLRPGDTPAPRRGGWWRWRSRTRWWHSPSIRNGKMSPLPLSTQRRSHTNNTVKCLRSRGVKNTYERCKLIMKFITVINLTCSRSSISSREETPAYKLYIGHGLWIQMSAAYLVTVWWHCTEAEWTVWPSWLLPGSGTRCSLAKMFWADSGIVVTFVIIVVNSCWTKAAISLDFNRIQFKGPLSDLYFSLWSQSSGAAWHKRLSKKTVQISWKQHS